MKQKLMLLSGIVLASPLVAWADVVGGGGRCGGPTGNVTTLISFICKIGDILGIVIPILIVLAVIYFIWGVITYVISDDEEAKQAGRNRIIFGIIGLAVIVGVWGLVRILTRTFNVDNPGTITYPTVSY